MLHKERKIKELDQRQTYKCLGINALDRVETTDMKEKVRKEYHKHIRLLLKAMLNAKNKLIGIDTLPVTVIGDS